MPANHSNHLPTMARQQTRNVWLLNELKVTLCHQKLNSAAMPILAVKGEAGTKGYRNRDFKHLLICHGQGSIVLGHPSKVVEVAMDSRQEGRRCQPQLVVRRSLGSMKTYEYNSLTRTARSSEQNSHRH
jgi:hypothetical protein